MSLSLSNRAVGVVSRYGTRAQPTPIRVDRFGALPTTWPSEFVRYGRCSATGGYDCSRTINHPVQIGVVAVFELNREIIGAVSDDYAGQLGWFRGFGGAGRFKVHVEVDARADFRPHRCVFE